MVFGQSYTADGGAGSGYAFGQGTTFMGGAQVGMHEFNPPYLGGSVTHQRVSSTGAVSNGLPTGWLRDGSIRSTVPFADGGLGIRSGALSSTSGTYSQSFTYGCAGSITAGGMCPWSLPWTFDYSVAGLPEGVTHLNPSARDVVDNGGAALGSGWDVKVDRTDPVATLSGVVDNEMLTDRTYSLKASASDALSGPSTASIKVDGLTKSSTTCPSSGPCEATYSMPGNSPSLTEGTHTLTATGTDVAGNPTSITRQFQVDRTDPTVEVEGTLNPEDRDWVGAGDQSLFVHATDAGSGVTSITTKIDGATVEPPTTADCPTGKCDLEADVTVHTDDLNRDLPGDQPLSEGTHSVTVEAKDAAGQVTTKQWSIRHDRQAPSLDLSGSLVDRQGQSLDQGGSYGLAAAASEAAAAGPRSGLGTVEIRVDGGDDPMAVEQRCMAGACALSRSFTYNNDEYPEGPHTVTVTATDYAGNQTVKTVSANNPAPPPANCERHASSPEASSSDAITSTAAADLLGSPQGLPQALGSATAMDLDGESIQPLLASGTADLWKSDGGFASMSLDRGAADGTSWILDTPDGPLCASPTVVGRDAEAAPALLGGTASLVANARSALDMAFRPTAVGLESFAQIRSAAAADRPVLGSRPSGR